MRHIAPKDQAELDAVETREWLESLDYVLQSGGPAKVARLLRELTIHARQSGVKLPFTANTPYINTISADEQLLMPGSPDLERRIKSLVRWNAAAMVVRARAQLCTCECAICRRCCGAIPRLHTAMGGVRSCGRHTIPDR